MNKNLLDLQNRYSMWAVTLNSELVCVVLQEVTQMTMMTMSLTSHESLEWPQTERAYYDKAMTN